MDYTFYIIVRPNIVITTIIVVISITIAVIMIIDTCYIALICLAVVFIISRTARFCLIKVSDGTKDNQNALDQ